MDTIFFEFVEPDIIVNPHYESHKRGRNWACKVAGKNSLNFDRTRLSMKGSKVSFENVQVGDAIEMGGDYISSSGNRQPDRGYYLITAVKDNGVDADCYTSIATLLKAKNSINKGE